MRLKIPALILICLISPVLISAQKPSRTPAAAPTAPPPGNMKLLNGYEHRTRIGRDSMVGEISKNGGMTIHYDIGFMAGNMTVGESQISEVKRVWSRRHKVNGADFMIAYFKDGKIIATFVSESANFYADTKDPRDVNDFLLMVKTYQPKK
jgi:hypothetical protein